MISKKQILILGFITFGLSQSMFAMEQEDTSKQMSPTEWQAILDEHLCLAIHDKNLNEVEELLKMGASANARIHYHDNPSHDPRSYKTGALNYAMGHAPNLELSKLLLTYGASMEKVNGVRPALFIVQNDTRSAKAFDMYNLLFDCEADISQRDLFIDEGKMNPLEWAAEKLEDTHYKSLIICAVFNPIDRRYFPSHKRIITALLVFKHLCPRMPKDIRKYLLRNDPELNADLQIISQFGKLSTIREEQAHQIPMPLVRILLQKGMLEPAKTVSTLKNNHIACVQPLMASAQTRVKGTKLDYINKEERVRMLNPDMVEENFGNAIEKNIRRRLGLLTWSEKALALVPSNSCVLQ